MVKGKKVTVTEETEPQARSAATGDLPQEEETPQADAEDSGEAEGGAGKDATDSALLQKLEKAEREARENYDKYLRVSAELDNFKKRSAREMEDFRKFSTEKLIKDLLPVVDNLERALLSAEDPAAEKKGIREGVDLTLREILRVLERFGLKSIQSLNEPFDPTYHQAMMQEPRDNVPGNTVVTELQKGYTLHDRLLRPAMVVVSAPTAAQENDAGNSG
jgi:molecular chaperone GrpE